MTVGGGADDFLNKRYLGVWGARSGREEHFVSCSSLGLESGIELPGN